MAHRFIRPIFQGAALVPDELKNLNSNGKPALFAIALPRRTYDDRTSWPADFNERAGAINDSHPTPSPESD